MMGRRLPTPKYGAVNLDNMTTTSEAKVEVMTCRPGFFHHKYRHINDPMEYSVTEDENSGV
jgi:hypothetical protein